MRTERRRRWVQNYNVNGSLRQRKQRAPKPRILGMSWTEVHVAPLQPTAEQGAFLSAWAKSLRDDEARRAPTSRKEFKERVHARKLALIEKQKQEELLRFQRSMEWSISNYVKPAHE
jgi:hypothetical protein